MKYPSVCAALVCALISVSFAGTADDEALEFELPKAYYGGTVVSYWSPHLDPRIYVDRPPVLAPKGTAVISVGKRVTASAEPTIGTLAQVTDGDKEFGRSSLLELPAGRQWVQIDLGEAHTIYAILLWHFHEGGRVYFDVVGQLSDDPEFKTGVTTIVNNDYDDSSGLGTGTDKEYIENSDGRLFLVDKISRRYVRFYSRGNTDHDFNNYVEIEVWGTTNVAAAGNE